MASKDAPLDAGLRSIDHCELLSTFLRPITDDPFS